MALGLAACGGDEASDAAAPTATSTSRSGGSVNLDLSVPTSSSAPRTTAPAATTAATMLDEVVARAAEYAGPDAWAHTTSIRNLSSILLVNTDWSSPADVDEDAANLICGGLYTWIQESGRSWPGPQIRTASLYGPESEGGVQVFDC